VEDSVSLLTISAVYLPPRNRVKQEQFEDCYNNLGQRIIAVEDYNAKHADWGYRLISFKGRELLKTMESNNLKHISTGEPTYWPSDRNTLPDLVDCCVTKGNPQDIAVAESCFDLSSDHFSILITLTADLLNQGNEPILSNKHANLDNFRRFVNERLTLNIHLKTEEDIEAAAKFFNGTIQCTIWNARPDKRHSRHATIL
jgi:hypothetical protein